MINAFINPKLLHWAIERSGVSPESLTKRMNIKPEKMALWKQGDDKPTFPQAQKLARVLHIPFGYLFLSLPPTEKLLLPDLRTLKDDIFKSPTPDFLDLLNDVLSKLDWYREYLQEQNCIPLKFVGRFSAASNAEEVAKDIVSVLGLDRSLREKVRTWEEFLRTMISIAQEKGILVMRSGIVGNDTHRQLDVNEFRGFAISDEMAPLIFINGSDAKAAQIFTLAHELAHIWIGASGISNLDISQPSTRQTRKVELFCNQVAAEMLVPKNSFLKAWRNEISIDDNLHNLARYYRVSSLVVLRRAVDLGRIDKEQYYDLYHDELERFKGYRRVGGKTGGDFYASLFLRNSGALTSALVSSVREGKILYREASRMLGVKVKTLQEISTRLGM